MEDVSLAISTCLAFFCFVLIVSSYIRIFSASELSSCALQHTQRTMQSAAIKAAHDISQTMFNITTVTEFLLLGFSNIREWQLIHAALFLLVYLAALMGNLLIIAVTTVDRHFHTPMYFFLKNLSIVDLGYISVTVPKSILNSLTNVNSISLLGCAAQVFLVFLFAGSELSLLTVMSHDRYVAICRPLHYEIIMPHGACVRMLAASWFCSCLSAIMYTASTFSLSFCGSNIVHQFFCDGPQLLRLSCSTDHVPEDVSLDIGISLAVFCFMLIVGSYARIFSAVLRMPSAEGRSKAFSTCLPHLVVVTLFVTSAFSAYLKPISDSPSAVDLLVSVFYAVVPPTLNPLIYSLRNRDIKAAMGRLLCPKHFAKEKPSTG
ncbi:olfactory receptor 14A16-like [Tachyglossus aculeatus]|uniref:olfactory receptor 14A16-like n=1 Tax=Tachyglossus aculeatus TaxID=9261 RepID=UPI0018F63BC3|nr:olfactory receptor 14A16-like [Tachyglossus aculeatus]